MGLDLKPYDVADYLTDTETIAAYLSQILEDGDGHELARALQDVARAKGGVGAISLRAGISPEQFARAVDDRGILDLETLRKILHAFGVNLSASPAPKELAAA